MVTHTRHPAPTHVSGEKRPLKICLLGYRSHPYSGGQGIYIKYLSKALVDYGHIVDVISGEPYPHLDSRVCLIKLPGLNLFESPNHVTALRWQHLKSYTDFFEWFSMLTGGFPEPYTFGRRVVDYFAKTGWHYDILHDNQSLCYGLLELQKQGIPIICTVHHPITSDLEIALAKADSWKLRLLIRRWHSFLRMQKKVIQQLDHVVSVSENSRADIAQAFDIPIDNIDMIYNGIDTEEFSPIPSMQRRNTRIMVTASADAPLKGLDYLLRAMALLREKHPDLELLVVGKLKRDGETSALIDKLGIRDMLTFVSGISTKELVEYYASATLNVVPSVYEGFGLPAGEAMACGVPVVSTRGGALPEVVGDAGILVPIRDARALASAINGLLIDPARRHELGNKGRERIVERFSWEVAAAQMTDFYHEVLIHAVANG